MRRRALVVLACSLAALATAAATGAAQSRAVGVGRETCAGGTDGWRAPASGRTLFTLRNLTARSYFLVQIVAADSTTVDPRYGFLVGKVFGQLDMLAPGTTAGLDAVLPPGRYFFRCLDQTGNSNDSEIEKVSGRAVPGARSYAPLDGSQLSLALLRYRVAVAPLIRRLAADTDRLTRAVRAGHLAAARELWVPAHLDYERLGVAYGTFGPLDGRINGRPFGLQKGARDPRFQGFLRLEYGLWHSQSRAELAPVAVALRRAVHTLRAQAASPNAPWVAGDLPLRAHEILENTLQFQLTGLTNEGSGTSLGTAWANARGTLLALQALRPLLQHGRDPQLISKTVGGTKRLVELLETYRRPSGDWRPLSSIPRRERERLDSELGALLEVLARIPGELQSWPANPSSSD